MIRVPEKCVRTFLFVLISACAIIVISCSVSDPLHEQNGEAMASFRYSLAAEQTLSFSIEGINGSIEIVGTENDSIEICGERIVRSHTRQDALEHLHLLQVHVRTLSSGIGVETGQPAHTEDRSYEVYYQIQLPRSMSVHADLVNGQIEIQEIQNTVQAALVHGDIDCNAIDGRCDIAVVNGGIQCALRLSENYNCSFSTVNGNILVAVPRAASAQLMARVTKGSISVNGIDVHNALATETTFSGILGSGQGAVQLQTVHGHIEVRGH